MPGTVFVNTFIFHMFVFVFYSYWKK